jgi:hypothetical protein
MGGAVLARSAELMAPLLTADGAELAFALALG